MKHKIIPLVLVLIAGLIGLYFLLSEPQDAAAPPVETAADVQNIAPSPTEETSTTTARVPKKYEVIYTADGFNPAVTSINAGDTVVFANKSDKDFWPASNDHPAHIAYPEFDAKTKIADGQTYEFVFTRSGAWGYHNHLNPKMMGVVVVKSR